MLTRGHHRAAGKWTLIYTHFFSTVLFIAILIVLSGCSSWWKAREALVVHHHDTLEVRQRDSIYLRDSVYVREWMKGDTVYIDRFRDRYVYRDRWRDSIQIQHDSVAVERTKEVKVEKPLNAWQRFRIGGFWWLLALAAVGWRKQLIWLIKKAAGLFG